MGSFSKRDLKRGTLVRLEKMNGLIPDPFQSKHSFCAIWINENKRVFLKQGGIGFYADEIEQFDIVEMAIRETSERIFLVIINITENYMDTLVSKSKDAAIKLLKKYEEKIELERNWRPPQLEATKTKEIRETFERMGSSPDEWQYSGENYFLTEPCACDLCNTKIKYVYIAKNIHTGKTIKMGEDCITHQTLLIKNSETAKTLFFKIRNGAAPEIFEIRHQPKPARAA